MWIKYSIWSNLDNDLIKEVKNMISQMKTIKCSDVEFFLAYPWFVKLNQVV